MAKNIDVMGKSEIRDNPTVMLKLIAILFFALAPLQMIHSEEKMFFSETTIDCDGDWYVDVDFDGSYEKVSVMDGEVFVFKDSQDVSEVFPYSIITAHSCCPAHTAYTTFNYTEHSIYSEAHYGSVDRKIRKIKQTDCGWIDVAAIRPLSIIHKDLYPHICLQRIFLGSSCHWIWGNGHGGFYYWLRHLTTTR